VNDTVQAHDVKYNYIFVKKVKLYDMNKKVASTTEVHSHSKNEITIKLGDIELGDIVSLAAHPYPAITQAKDHNGTDDSPEGVKNKNPFPVKISAYNHFTPPLMIVTEVKHGLKYDKESGKQKDSFKCLFYSTSAGAFEENWFRLDEIKLIEKGKSLFSDHENHDLTHLKKKLIGTKAILITVDMELGKKVVFPDTNPLKKNPRQKSLLDFLPPLGTIINISTIPQHIKYDETSGKIDFEKCRILAKLRWYNNHTGKISEKEIPLNALKNVPEPAIRDDINPDIIYIIPKPILLENYKSPVIQRIPVKFQDIIFKHYYYEYRVRNLFNNQLEIYKSDSLTEGDGETIILMDEKIESWFEPLTLLDSEEKLSEEKVEKWKDKWIQINYIDRSGQYTTRIIFVRGITKFPFYDSPSPIPLIEANCLLRDGAIRHFRIDRIMAYKVEKEDGFDKYFIKKSKDNPSK